MWNLSTETLVLVQGVTGHQGGFHTDQMRQFGTKVVAGVSPGKGNSQVNGVPVFNDVQEAVEKTNATASVVFVPAARCLDATLEAMNSGIKTLVVVTEHIPLHDSILMRRYAELRRCHLLGPNCPGIGAPGEIKLGIMPNDIFSKGNVAVVSRSGTLTYEVVQHLTMNGLGQSICVGVGGDQVNGTTLKDVLLELASDQRTKAVVLIGEIGGRAEQEAATVVGRELRKPVVAYVAGRTAPPGKRMGHAGAIISQSTGTYEEKRRCLESRKVIVCDRLEQIAERVSSALSVE